MPDFVTFLFAPVFFLINEGYVDKDNSVVIVALFVVFYASFPLILFGFLRHFYKLLPENSYIKVFVRFVRDFAFWGLALFVIGVLAVSLWREGGEFFDYAIDKMITNRKLASERREEQKKVDSLKIYLEVEREMKCEEILETKIKTFLKLSEHEQSQLLSYQEQNCKDIKQ